LRAKIVLKLTGGKAGAVKFTIASATGCLEALRRAQAGSEFDFREKGERTNIVKAFWH